MGVPALFRWLSQKYPKIISPVIEELAAEVDNGDGTKTKVPIDARNPNPNGEEMDNLYLDMNGIVHPCSHPEDRPPPANEEEMMIAVFEYTERVVNMVRPRKLLMIAVDGVAPRAKMNQQRSRRFRSAQEAAEKDKATAEYHADLKAQGRDFDLHGEEMTAEGERKVKKTWDSNAITPGTPFMDILAASLRYWVSFKLSTDPAWERLKVIISDATVPGEGEHKIMNFVRSQRSSPTHDANTRHVIYGLDADLIMLGIATHEPHFRVLREDVFANDTKPGHCRKCNQPGHIADQCRGAPKPKEGEEAVEKPLKPFIWLHVSVLREYLAVEMYPPNQGFRFDLERALDDWVFMCFFVGNDFLPHLPSLDIRENGIDTLIAIWRDNIPAMGGYVTKDGHVDLARAQAILGGLAKQEDAIFKRRKQSEDEKEAKAKRRAEMNARRESNKRPRYSNDNNGTSYGGDESLITRGPRGGVKRGPQEPDINALPTFAPGQAQTRADPRYAQQNLTHADIVGANAANRSAAAVLKEKLMGSRKAADNQKAEVDALMAGAAAGVNGSAASQSSGMVLGKRRRDMISDAAADDDASSDPSTPGRNTPNKEIADPTSHGASRGTSGQLGGNKDASDETPEDSVKLWEPGYAGRYYSQKFHVSEDDIAFRHKVARSYVEGLCWVLLYYFQGCPSWTWYYPYHYAPFAADFTNMADRKVEFEHGKPFRPYEQLMGVMPAASNHTIPAVFHPLMTEETSPIKEFYPEDFEIDLNGKKFAWQGIALLPFIDEKRLLEAMGTKYPELTDDERRRNAFGSDALIFSTRHPLYEDVAMSFYSKKAGAPKFKINARVSEGLAGKVAKQDSFTPNSSLEFPLEATQQQFTRLESDESVTVSYTMPSVGGVHKSMLLPGVVFDEAVLDYTDVQKTREMAQKSGRSHGGVTIQQNGDRSDGRRINYAARDSGGRDGVANDSYGGNGYGPNGGYGAGAARPYEGRAQQVFASLPPHLAQQAAAHGFPPPPPGVQGYQAPPAPPRHQGHQGSEYNGQDRYDSRGGYGGQDAGYGGGGYGRQDGYGRQQQGGYEDRGGYGAYSGGGGGYSTAGYSSAGSGYGGGGGYQGGNRGGRRY